MSSTRGMDLSHSFRWISKRLGSLPWKNWSLRLFIPMLLLLLLSHFSRVRLCVTPWTAPPSLFHPNSNLEKENPIIGIELEC